MVRIKGANSDYVYTGNPKALIEEQKDADSLYLKIFICPYDMPSHVEPNDGEVCQGTDAECPHGENSFGHALICLHEKDGISLVTNNQITAHGSFVVKPENSQELFKVEPQGTTIQGVLDFNGGLRLSHDERELSKAVILEIADNTSLIIKSQAVQDVVLEISDKCISMQMSNGAKININERGDIELSPSNKGKVKINGDLEVTGEIKTGNDKLDMFYEIQNAHKILTTQNIS
ncbi:MAG: hypothetical protein V7K41_15315 [Nostoc sp.]|uniref:hypothetical protein n=1 Tax=Nostoc sp. TaxID=1180 RepID=UPI002FFAD973